MEKRTEISQKSLIVFVAVSLFYYLWVTAQIPYCHDDWDWGLPVGIQQLLTANLNSRYVGNFIEVVLTRSLFLKTACMGTVFALIPLYAVRAISFAAFPKLTEESAVSALVLGHILMVTVPPQIWEQTFGWVAGFSNFVVSAFFLVLYQILVIKLLRDKESNIFQVILVTFFGIAIQLLLENVAVYVVLCSTAVLLFTLVKRHRVSKSVIGLWGGNLVGTVIMFSSSVYKTLAENGTAIDGYRTLSFDRGEGLIRIAVSFVRRFMILYPDFIWIRNTVLCCALLVLMTLLQMVKQRNIVKRFAWTTINLLFFVYTISHRFAGDIQLPSQWWTNVLRAGIASLYFVVVLIQGFLLLHEDQRHRNLFLFFWLSAPAVLLPMTVVSSVGWRSYLTSDLFLLETCLLLFMKLIVEEKNRSFRKAAAALFAAALCVIWGYFGVVYHDIGIVRIQRLELITQAREGETNSILLKAFPHGEYLWGPDPEYGSERVKYFRQFYQIPENVDLWFQNWADDRD